MQEATNSMPTCNKQRQKSRTAVAVLSSSLDKNNHQGKNLTARTTVSRGCSACVNITVRALSPSQQRAYTVFGKFYDVLAASNNLRNVPP